MDEGYGAWAARWRVPMGFALGAAYLIFSRPTLKLLAAGGLLALAGVLLRGVAAGYLAKDRSLTTRGPYAYTRNPLYLGSLLIGLGSVLAAGSWALAAAFLVFFLAIYRPVMRREAEGLRRRFGEAYEQYARDVPLFVPRLPRAHPVPASPICGHTPAQEAGKEEPEKFQWQRYRRNREYKAALGYLAALVFLALKAWLR